MKKNYINFFKKKRVLITGNTGFVGSYLSMSLSLLGANVLGYALKKDNKNYISNFPDYKKKIKTIYDDIDNLILHKNTIKKFSPQILIHLASQPLVLNSYLETKETFNTNVMGTVKIFELSKELKFLKNILIFTSDKVYKNANNKILIENSYLGGTDPYSASKSAQDIIAQSYKESFFKNKKNVFIVRAGNIIGGGDWEKTRLVPDLFLSLSKKKDIILRNHKAIRPWQHILNITDAILLLLSKKSRILSSHSIIYNIGPKNEKKITVLNLIKKFIKKSKLIDIKLNYKKIKFIEKKLLILSSSKFYKDLLWKPSINLNESIKLTADWYFQFFRDKKNIFSFTENQIKKFLGL